MLQTFIKENAFRIRKQFLTRISHFLVNQNILFIINNGKIYIPSNVDITLLIKWLEEYTTNDFTFCKAHFQVALFTGISFLSLWATKTCFSVASKEMQNLILNWMDLFQ